MMPNIMGGDKEEMLSNIFASLRRFVVIIDDLGHEILSEKFLTQQLREKGEDGQIKILAVDSNLSNKTTIEKFLHECNLEVSVGKEWKVILPPLSDFLAYQKPSEIISCIHKLKRNKNVKQIYLWISTKHVLHDHSVFLIAACEYIADAVLYLQTENELTILERKQWGAVKNIPYTYNRTNTEFTVKMKTTEQKLKSAKGNEEDSKPDQMGTFKIELEEEEMMARKAMKMPYEKAIEATESNIIYTPDAADDFDEEDPDEDLVI